MDLSGMLGSAGGADPMKLAGAIQQVFAQKGGVDGFVNQLRAGGLGSEVDSWVSTGANEPVEPKKLADALGPDTVNQLASSSGLDVGQLLPMLAGLLPQIVDFLTPGGQLPSMGGVGSLPDLGGLLGGLMGGGGSPAGSSGQAGSGGLGGLGGALGGMLGGSRDTRDDAAG